MENRFTSEMIEKAKAAQSAEEILALAKENNLEMTVEEARKYYEQLHKTGELADEELGSVAGGGCESERECNLCGATMRRMGAGVGAIWYCTNNSCKNSRR